MIRSRLKVCYMSDKQSSIEVQAMKMLADDDFLALDSRLNRPNVFEAVNLGHAEIRHSAFLAWLLNPSNPHGLGDLFIRRLLAELFEENPSGGFASLAADDLTELKVVRESESNIDLLIRTQDNRLVVCVENKIFSGLHDRQLDRYHRYAEHMYGEYRYRLYVLLTPAGYEPPDEQSENPSVWLPFSYSSLAEVMESLIPYANGRARICIEDYISLLKKENIMKDDELDELASKLYGRYRGVFDLVNERCAGQAGVAGYLRGIYLSVLNEYKESGRFSDCAPLDSTGVYLSFHTAGMDVYLHNDRSRAGTWGNPSDTYHYWVYPTLLKPTIKLELGPFGQPSDVIQAMESLRRVAKARNPGISPDNHYRVVKSIPARIDETETVNADDVDVEGVKNKLRKALDNMLDFEKKTLDELGVIPVAQ